MNHAPPVDGALFSFKPNKQTANHFQLHYLRLPKDISEDYVILMDSTVSTGAAALMAVRVLLVRPPAGSKV